MGEVRILVVVANHIDLGRVATGELASARSAEVEAVVDTGTVRSVIPEQLAPRACACADAARLRSPTACACPPGITTASIVIQGWDTQEEVYVIGDEVLIGRATLEALDMSVDCNPRRVVPHHPEGPVLFIR
jgi:hypothetical protein